MRVTDVAVLVGSVIVVLPAVGISLTMDHYVVHSPWLEGSAATFNE